MVKKLIVIVSNIFKIYTIDTEIHFLLLSGNETVSIKYKFTQLNDKEMEVLYKSQDLYEIDGKLCAKSASDLSIYYVSVGIIVFKIQ